MTTPTAKAGTAAPAEHGTVNAATSTTNVRSAEDAPAVEQPTRRRKHSAGLLCSKVVPDPQIVAKDIKDQLKGTDFGIALQSKITTTMKEVDMLIRCNRDVGPYLRRPLIDLRRAVKQKVKNDDEKVGEELKKFQLRFERVKAKRHQIVETREVKNVESDNLMRMFQVYICDNIRICSMDKMTDLQAVMADAKKFQRLIKDIERLTIVNSFSTKMRGDIRKTLQIMDNMLALDAIHALRMTHEGQVLKNAVVKGKTAEEEIEKRLRAMKPKLVKITKECEAKRDDAEKSLREVRWKVMAQMDKEINEVMNNLREKNRYADNAGNVARQVGQFWVPPPLTDVLVGREYFDDCELLTGATLPLFDYLFEEGNNDMDRVANYCTKWKTSGLTNQQ